MSHLPLVATLAWSLSGTPALQPTPDAAPPSLTDLHFLAGAWEHDQDGTLMREVWDEARGDAMVGHFVLVNDGHAALYELFTVEQEENAAPVLRLRHYYRGLTPWASESERPLSLTLDTAEHSRAVFSNPDNDFPQQMVYEVKGDALVVTLIPAAESARSKLMLEFSRVPHVAKK
jgi:hypothetical protein